MSDDEGARATRDVRDDDDGGGVEPPDGGAAAWLVMVGAFLCNGILFGVINSYGVLYEEIYANLNARNVTDASSKAALVGSLAMGTTFIVSPVSGVISDAFGIRRTTFLGGAIASTGMFLSSIFPHNVHSLCVTYGVMYGLGSALAYTPSLAILGHYFRRRMGIANGVATTGSAVFTAFLPHAIARSLTAVGLVWTLRLLALLAGGIMLAALLFRPIGKPTTPPPTTTSLAGCVNVAIFRNRRYLLWCVVLPASLFGYFVPYVHMTKFVGENFAADVDGKWPVICIGVASGVGRLAFGYASDGARVDRLRLQQVALLVVGATTSALPSTAGRFGALCVGALLMGLFDGCFVAMLGPIAFDLCGRRGAAQGIGALLGLCAVPLTLGPYLAGVLYDHTASYDLAFRIAGVPPMLGALALCFVRCVDKRDDAGDVGVPLKGNGHHVSETAKSNEHVTKHEEKRV